MANWTDMISSKARMPNPATATNSQGPKSSGGGGRKLGVERKKNPRSAAAYRLMKDKTGGGEAL